MPFTITSKQFDIATSLVSVVSFIGGFGSSGPISKSIWRGLQSFSHVSSFDIVARRVLANDAKKKTFLSAKV